MTAQPSDKTSTSKQKEIYHDIFEDPAIARAAQEDPLVKFLSVHWKRVVIALVAIPCLTYAYNVYHGVQESKRASATQVLTSVRSSFSEIEDIQTQLITNNTALAALKPTDTEKKTELDNKLKDLTERLTGTRARLEKQLQALSDVELAPFPIFAKLYRGLLATRENRLEDARANLGSVTWEGLGDTPERFAGEVAALSLARAELDDIKSLEDGRKMLQALGERGTYTRVSALKALAAIAETAQQKLDAKTLIEKLIAEQPEQAKFLSDEMEFLK